MQDDGKTAERDRARRKLSRRFAATVLQAMTETDMGFAEIASRLGKRETTVRRWFDKMVDGSATALDPIAMMMAAMGCKIDLDIRQDSSQDSTAPERPRAESP